jgi:hypothetical protein
MMSNTLSIFNTLTHVPRQEQNGYQCKAYSLINLLFYSMGAKTPGAGSGAVMIPLFLSQESRQFRSSQFLGIFSNLQC